MKIIDRSRQVFKFLWSFGPRLTWYYWLYPKFNSSYSSIMEVRHREVKRFLSKKYASILDRYKDVAPNGDVIDESYPIWFCWLQGEEQMPEAIRLCYDSVKRHAGNRRVVLITDENISRYITIPDFIIKKRKQGIISRTHFSDYMRMRLLKEYGGLWVDATMYVNCPLSLDYGKPFFTGKEAPTESKQFVSEFRWTVSLMSSCKNGLLASVLVNLFEAYLSKYNTYVDFYIFDYFVAICYDSIPQIRQQIDEGSLLMTDKFVKLSWKKNYPIIDQDGNDTFYGRVLREYKERKFLRISHL